MSVERFNTAVGVISDFDILKPDNVKFLQKRIDEKGQLQLLNTRFAAYIEKIRSLMQQNHELTMEVTSLRSYKSTSITEMRTEEMRKLINENDGLKCQITAFNVQRDKLQKRLDIEIRLREEAEKRYEELSVELEAEKQKLKNKIHELEQNITLNGKIHEKEIVELKKTVQVKGKKGSDQVDMSNSELEMKLEKIRKQYEVIVNENITNAEKLYKHQLEEQKTADNEKWKELSQANKTIEELKTQIQNLTSEISSLNSKITNTENHHKHEKEKWELQITQNKTEMSKQLCKYQELLCLKMGLDIEINYYRQLLEEEERRIGMQKKQHKTPDFDPSSQTVNVEITETITEIIRIVKKDENCTTNDQEVSQGEGHSGKTSPRVTEMAKTVPAGFRLCK